MNIDGENVDERHYDKMRKERNPADVDHHTLNPIQKKMLREEKEHEYQAINKNSEGRCWGCGKTDLVRPVVVDACMACIGKRGDYHDSSLLTFIAEKIEIYCGLCKKWKLGKGQDGMGGASLNARVCLKCADDIRRNIREYKGIMSNPFYAHLRRKQGKDWAILEMYGGSKWRK